MTVKENGVRTPFFAHLEETFTQRATQDEVKLTAWKEFLQLGLPTKKSERFHYVPLKDLYQNTFSIESSSAISQEVISASVLEACRGSYLVFVDGCFRKDLSCVDSISKQVLMMNLSQARKSSYGSFYQTRTMQRLVKEKDPFFLMNAAMSSDGLFLYVPPKVIVEAPIQCIQCFSKDRGSMVFPKAQVFIGAGAKVEWISSQQSGSVPASFYYNGATDISVEEGAHFSHYLLADSTDGSWIFDSVRATVKKGGIYHSSYLSCGGKCVRYDVQVSLCGEGSEARLHGLSFLEGKNQSHIHVEVEHDAPGCRSHQWFKNVLTDHSLASFAGKIFVRQIAQKTEAYQLNNSLLLSDGAIVNSKPMLEIFADDVKASHGATISELNEEQLFYLQTRGLSREQAKALLTLGFCKDIISEIPIDCLRSAAFHRIEAFLAKHQG